MIMWHWIEDRIPIFILAILSLLIPWGIYKLNQAFHQYADPPWKKDDESQ